jgi:2-C-methyl-D-erythritol 2,4-cyclodiphosphate synthase
MFEAFGERANAVIRMAETEANKLGHKLVGTEHILVAISAIEDCVAAKIMQKCGLSHEILRQDLIKLTGWGEKLDFGGNLIFDPCAKKAMEYSMEEMVQDQKEFISVEHLFLGITRKSETIASILLEKRGQLRARLREEIRTYLESPKRIEKISDTPVAEEEYRRNRAEDEVANNLLAQVRQLGERLSSLEKVATIRMGIGFDSHVLVKGRKLILGGVRIPFPMGLKGHSDADALLHAIIDALLGALGAGDIGTHFPDTDKKYEDISSVTLMAECEKMISAKGFRIENLDTIIIAEKPKIAPFAGEMRKVISGVLQMSPQSVSVKAKTAEGMGFVGEGKGIASLAIAALRMR